VKIGIFLEADLRKPGGVQEHARGLAKALSDKGEEVYLITPRSKEEKTAKKGVKFLGQRWEPAILMKITGSSVPAPFTWACFSEIKDFLIKEKFDVLHFQAPFSLFLGYQLLWSARKQKIVKIATFHIYTESRWAVLMSLFLRPLRLVVNLLEARIAVSQAARKVAQKMFPGEYLIIPNAVDLSRFQPGKEQKNQILFVGRLDKRKGVMYLLKAFVKLKKRILSARLVIVGKGPYEERAKEFVKEQSLEDVEFKGYISDKELPKFYQQASVVCFPSLGGESFGIVLLEAMASGKPVVAFNIDGYREVLVGRLSRWLMPLKDVEVLGRALLILLKNRSLREQYGRLGLQTVRQYSWPQVSSRILKVYKRVGFS